MTSCLHPLCDPEHTNIGLWFGVRDPHPLGSHNLIVLSVVMAEGESPVPSRTRKLNPPAPMVLHSPGGGGGGGPLLYPLQVSIADGSGDDRPREDRESGRGADDRKGRPGGGAARGRQGDERGRGTGGPKLGSGWNSERSSDRERGGFRRQ